MVECLRTEVSDERINEEIAIWNKNRRTRPLSEDVTALAVEVAKIIMPLIHSEGEGLNDSVWKVPGNKNYDLYNDLMKGRSANNVKANATTAGRSIAFKLAFEILEAEKAS